MPQAPMAQGLLELLSLQQALMAQWLPQAPTPQGSPRTLPAESSRSV